MSEKITTSCKKELLGEVKGFRDDKDIVLAAVSKNALALDTHRVD